MTGALEQVHIERLADRAQRLENDEAHARMLCGECQPGSVRHDTVLEARSIRAALACLGAAQGQGVAA